MEDNGIWHQAAEIIGTMRKNTALFPLLVVDVILTILCAVLMAFVSLAIQITLISLLGVSVLATIGQCIYFMITDPDRLGSQTQILQRRALDLLADESHKLGTTAADIVAVVNPKNSILPTDFVQIEKEKNLCLPPVQPPPNTHE